MDIIIEITTWECWWNMVHLFDKYLHPFMVPWKGTKSYVFVDMILKSKMVPNYLFHWIFLLAFLYVIGFVYVPKKPDVVVQ